MALLYAQRAAELGAEVVFVATEEQAGILRTKALTQAPSLYEDLGLVAASDARPAEVHWVDGAQYESLRELERHCQSELAVIDNPASALERNAQDLVTDLPIGSIIVIDSLTALLPYVGSDQSSPHANDIRSLRAELHDVLSNLRETGVSVVLVGGAEVAADGGLGYLVDNVIVLSSEGEMSPRPPTRYLTISKTRYQKSARGRHVLHLAGRKACTTSPSLHAMLRRLSWRQTVLPSAIRRAIFPAQPVPTAADEQLDFGAEPASEDRLGAPLVIRDQSQVLLYGHGPTGKSLLALQASLETRVSITADTDLDAQLLERAVARRERRRTAADEVTLQESRALVISFLYSPEYYARHMRRVLERRFLVDPNDVEPLRARMLRVKHFEPGFIDPETLVQSIWGSMQQAQMEGRPFTSVVLDGIHNILVQFPQLQDELLLWSALYRLFRSTGVSVTSTFTVFNAGGASKNASSGFEQQAGALSRSRLWTERAGSSAVAVWEQLLFHLLVSTADYSLSVEREDRRAVGGGAVTVVLESSLDRGRKRPLSWHADTLEFSAK